jgi:hypothetical protein
LLCRCARAQEAANSRYSGSPFSLSPRATHE